MKLQNQYTSVETSKIITQLGVNERTTFEWVRSDCHEFALIPMNYYEKVAPEYNPIDYMGIIHECYSAFNSDELGVMLHEYLSKIYTAFGKFNIFFQHPKNIIKEEFTTYQEAGLLNECEARGLLLIYIIKNRILSIEEINARLKNN